MKVIRKFMILIVALTFTFIVTGCGTRKLEKAFEEIEETSYTLSGEMKIEISMNYYGQTQKQTVTSEMTIEADPTQVYTVTTVDNTSEYAYTKIDGDNVKVFSEVNGIWILSEELSLDDYSGETLEIFEIDAEDVFEKDGDVWVGNVEKLSNELKDYMEELAGSLVASGVTISSTTIDKYNIELDGKHLSKIDLEMSMSMSYSFNTIEMKVFMPLEFSKIGETEVTVPSGLPE